MEISKITQRFLLGLMVISVGTVRPIPSYMAPVGASIVGGVAGAAIYQSDWKWLSLPIAGVGGVLGYWFLNQFTPEGRMARAADSLCQIELYGLSNTTFTTEEDTVRGVHNLYVMRTWPLVAATDDLTNYIDKAFNAMSLADAAAQEESIHALNARNIKNKLHMYVENMKKVLIAIRSHKDYSTQLNQFKEEQRHKENLHVQQTMAAAQLGSAHAQQQMAASQKELVALQKDQAYRGATRTVSAAPVATYSHRQSYTSDSSVSHEPGTMSERELDVYVSQNIVSFERALRSHMRFADLTTLKNAIEVSIKNARYAEQKKATFFSSGKRYKEAVVEQFMKSAVIEFVETMSYRYAHERTHDSLIAKRISASMRNNALAVLSRGGAINFDALAPFVGYALEKAIEDKLRGV